jgi:hypothetical protein
MRDEAGLVGVATIIAGPIATVHDTSSDRIKA